jgi:N-acetylneuraminic acid mutarotase
MLFRKMLGTKSVIGFLLVVTLPGISSIILAQGGPWSTKAPMLTERMCLAAGVVNGKIYAIGGTIGRETTGLQTVEEYDPMSDTWTMKAPMPTARECLAASAVNGKIYAIGGSQTWFGSGLNIVEEYDPETDIWVTKTPMPTARLGLSTCVLNEKIYAIGGLSGWSSNDANVHAVEEYDPATDKWTSKAEIPNARTFLSMGVVNGKIYTFGGASSAQVVRSVVEVYDPVSDTWTDTTAQLPASRGAGSTSVVNGKIYVIGGIPSNFSAPVSKMEEYDPVTDTWVAKTNMPTARLFHVEGTVNDKIYIVGGSLTGLPNVSPTAVVEVYDPAADTVSVTSIENYTNLNPTSFELSQNYPNPFNPATTIPYILNQKAQVKLTVYDLLGREVQVLVNAQQPAGTYNVSFNGKNLAGGIYLYKLQAESQNGERYMNMKKLILIK